MRYPGLLASGLLLVGGLAGARADDFGEYGGEWKLDVGGITSSSYRDAFHLGYGAGGGVAYEKAYGGADSRFGLRGSLVNYERDHTQPQIPENFQEYSVGGEALVGPALNRFEPKAGGHIGFMRQDGAGPIGEENALDVGLDVMAAVEFSPTTGMQAVLTPLWLITDEDTDYQTRAALNVEFNLTGV